MCVSLLKLRVFQLMCVRVCVCVRAWLFAYWWPNTISYCIITGIKAQLAALVSIYYKHAYVHTVSKSVYTVV